LLIYSARSSFALPKAFGRASEGKSTCLTAPTLKLRRASSSYAKATEGKPALSLKERGQEKVEGKEMGRAEKLAVNNSPLSRGVA